jgi:hypothetical protein
MLMAVLLIPVWAATQASGAPKDCTQLSPNHPNYCGEDPPPTTTDQPIACAEDLGSAVAAVDDELTITATEGYDCNDIAAVDSGTTFTFTFSVTGDPGTAYVLGIRNSVPGDWCSGLWTVRDADGNVLFGGVGNAIRPRGAANDSTATLVIGEDLTADGNCTDGGTLRLHDADAAHWVVSLTSAGGRPLRGSESISVTWTPVDPTP